MYPMKTLEERFWEKVEIRGHNECWNWKAFRDKDGYGKINVKQKCFRASRVSWELKNGPVKSGFIVMHKCDNPPCVNPNHLQLGTYAENNRDRAYKGRNRNQNGEKNNMAKLDNEAISVIRHLYKNTRLSAQQISEIFNVARPTITLIVEGKRWK